ncbi:GNAT family N-acetyltransferase [Streptomyces durbertensis]|uniref:GNAT family N-acetyltransferase n=1 Tax=Streptomyces durbertensis TaxID=2448886 RepID=A0ABR6E9W5_9ACTN|nr:GNAT family N-acetyltransferase [Streptomyces durbertensis]MBB1242135.1 GNAT family N-acetyltransferase [Streptomyces durbertensis]
MIEIREALTTRRLVLRPFQAADEDDMYAFESLPEVARYLYNNPRSRAETAAELARRQGQTALREEGDTLVLAVEADGRVIGYVLLEWLSRRHRQGEFGFVFHPGSQGRGYASEAAVEMLRLGFEELGLHRVIGRCDPRNEGSWRLMERLGMRREAHFVESEIFKDEWGSELHYAMLASEWRASRWATAPAG